MEIKTRKSGDVYIIDIQGDMDLYSSYRLKDLVKKMLQSNVRRLIVNLDQVEYIDSSGIGELVSSFTAVKKEGGILKLLSLTQKIQDLLAITKLLTVFDTFDDEASALSSYN